uniref:CD276 antigen homolog n=1 Tax=Centroberyx gerrardi TaxID=166262 RepID=UPI003AB0D9FD
MLSLLVSTASGQGMISGFRGQDVLLPCTYSQPDKLQPGATVFWRGKDDLNIYDIISNKPDLSSQESRFRKRIHSFPELYSQGNFSIVLQQVQLTDSGPYDCFIPLVSIRHRVQLSITGERVTEEGEPDAGKRNGSAAVRVNPSSLLLFLLFGKTVLLYGN